MFKKITLVLTLLIILSIFSFSIQKKNNPSLSTETSSIQNIENNTQKNKEYSLEEVSIHNSKQNCWLVINDNVYDVTQFISNHPGGDAILQGCGTDATELFNTRPMGSRTPHSDKAKNNLSNFYIGNLKK